MTTAFPSTAVTARSEAVVLARTDTLTTGDFDALHAHRALFSKDAAGTVGGLEP